ncbi:EAL domain-containing protein [Anoxybacillus sp. CHMUD]|uniref:EAL domain-containing protein n=1 Tax=Anoxybacillus sp. CHMUD TaxID=2508870 RepID=UPI00209BF043|nr:EAL domain-containing protein [Anoxybacillus sp. CHMUD]
MIVSVLATICFIPILLLCPSLTMTFEQNHFLSFHTILELFSITFAMAIALQGWISFPQSLSRRRLRIATTFLLEQTCFQPQYIELEITENIALSDEKQVIETIQALKQMGIRIAIDDFGSGYSSIAYLRHISVDTLKIDKSFLSEIVTYEKAPPISRGAFYILYYLLLNDCSALGGFCHICCHFFICVF